MTMRELWRNIMFYGEFDRMPVIHWTEWEETRRRWLAEGLPPDVSEHQYFGTVPHWTWVGVGLELYPPFAEETLEDTDEYRIFRDGGGVVQKDWKHRSCIPTFLDFTLKEAKDWDAFKKRLQPDPGRISKDLDKRIADAEASELPIAIGTASMMGWIRNWMGVENMCYLMFDAPDVYADMVDTLAELTCWGIDQVIPKMTSPPDMGFGWEDICGKSGPLVSPQIFDKHVAPGYRKIRDKLESCGVTMLGVDSDGMVEPLLRSWLEAGVNLQFPIEIGTWNADPHALRRKFGRDLRVVGGFNKLALEKDHAAIDAEIERRIPIMKEGGFIIMPDHLITPGVSLENYKYYLNRIRELRL
ncbi:MAG TPA: uroporphyrinogen decarboxylase family protein [Phycisphaerae bacterium]|nr:uroporphyrinogen decarboxylase family protein [Phycisphaerae bacterium]